MGYRRIIWLNLCTLFCILLFQETKSFEVVRRSTAPERESEDYPDYLLGVRYDEYPAIVPKKKKAVLLLDRIMDKFQNYVEGKEESNKLNPSLTKNNYGIEDVRSMDLQRRGHQGSLVVQPKGRNYWRCYFNAVTCF